MAGTDNPDALAQLAKQALGRDAAAAVPPLAAWCRRHRDDVTTRHWLALLHRDLDEREDALAVLAEASALAPDSAGIVHALAQVSLEAGKPAVGLFERAATLKPADGEIRLGLASARFAEGQGQRGLGELEAMLAANPGWIDGHRAYARLAAQLGAPDRALVSLERALAAHPDGAVLYQTGIAMLLDGERFDAALDLVGRAISRCGELPDLLIARAAALDETGDSAQAGALFDRLGAARDTAHLQWRLRHLLRQDAPDTAARELEPWLERPGAELVWPYAALAWRMIADPRSAWLEEQEGLTATFDLAGSIDLAALADLLRTLHRGSGRFLDQSVRDGTQTASILLARTDPVIAQVRDALRGAVQRYIAQLPPADPGHPTLRWSRAERPRFAGSWSVRLEGEGFHASHHHPLGWISSALYISVPEDLAQEEGHLYLGEGPAGLGAGVSPHRVVRPLRGRLALFPSWMWHGTRPFTQGERMTIAFDVARPSGPALAAAPKSP